MIIFSGKDLKTESPFEIKDIVLISERMHDDYVDTCARVVLEPSRYTRERGFGGRSREAKKYPAVLIIEFAEVQKIMEALTSDLQACRQILTTHDLLDELDEAKRKKQKEGNN
jgi:hypothetical protein